MLFYCEVYIYIIGIAILNLSIITGLWLTVKTRVIDSRRYNNLLHPLSLQSVNYEGYDVGCFSFLFDYLIMDSYHVKGQST